MPKPTTTLIRTDLETHAPKAEPVPKKRNDSPETIALRHVRERRQLLERIKAEDDRHHERSNALQGDLERHDAKALSKEARAIVEKLLGAG